MQPLLHHNFFSGGYFITTTIPKPQWGDNAADSKSGEILTASRCLANVFPDDWALNWVNCDQHLRAEKASLFNVDIALHQRLFDRISSEFDKDQVRFPGIFVSVEIAREIAQAFITDKTDLHLIGMGLHADYLQLFQTQETLEPGIGNGGVWQCVTDRHRLAAEGELLGFEILGYDFGTFHSWYCNQLEDAVASELAIVPAERGLLADWNDAVTAGRYCGEEGTGAEPGLWLPRALVEYTF